MDGDATGTTGFDLGDPRSSPERSVFGKCLVGVQGFEPIEGDLAYASCWYRKAGRKVSGDHLETERNSIVAELIRSSV